MKFEEVVQLVQEERAKQDEQWGGPEHDIVHVDYEWIEYIDKQVKRGYELSQDSPEFVEPMVKIAALAFAALEARR